MNVLHTTRVLGPSGLVRPRAAAGVELDGVELSPQAMRALLQPAEKGQPELAWSHPHGANLWGGCALSQDQRSLFQSSQRKLFCLDALTGLPRWTYEAPVDNFEGPVVVGAKGLAYVTSRDGTFHAVDPTSGKAAWTSRIPAGGGWPSHGPDGEIVVSCRDQTVGVSPEDGSILWTSPVHGREVAVGKNGRMFAAGDGLKCLVAYDRDTGAELWRKDHGHCRHQPAVGPDGTVYLGNVAGRFMAVDPESGELKWSKDTGRHIIESPTVGPDGAVYVGNLAGQLFCFDPATRDQRWVADVGADVRQAPAIGGDGSIVLASDKNVVMAFSPSQGSRLWSQPAASYVHCTPALSADGQVYFGANNATLYSYKVPSQALDRRELAGAPRQSDAPGLGFRNDRLVVGQSSLPLRHPSSKS